MSGEWYVGDEYVCPFCQSVGEVREAKSGKNSGGLSFSCPDGEGCGGWAYVSGPAAFAEGQNPKPSGGGRGGQSNGGSRGNGGGRGRGGYNNNNHQQQQQRQAPRPPQRQQQQEAQPQQYQQVGAKRRATEQVPGGALTELDVTRIQFTLARVCEMQEKTFEIVSGLLQRIDSMSEASGTSTGDASSSQSH